MVVEVTATHLALAVRLCSDFSLTGKSSVQLFNEFASSVCTRENLGGSVRLVCSYLEQ